VGEKLSLHRRLDVTDTGTNDSLIARSPYDLAATLKVWLGSPGHCANIMNPDFTEMGGAVYETYWTTVFGKPALKVLVEYPDEQLPEKTVQPKPRKKRKE
jgi:hypothetical protein